jgi:hypothetical protein
VPCHQSKTVHQQFGAICGNLIFQSILIHIKSDMVKTRSSHPLTLLAGTRATSSNQETMDFMKSMAESMEVLRKQNDDLNTRLTVAEARSSQKEKECKERREKERRDRVRRGKWPVNPEQQDNESMMQGENKENRDKSRRVESLNGG